MENSKKIESGKNLYLLPTDKQIKNVGDLVKDLYGDIHIFTKNDGKEYGKTTTKLNIYITNSEVIKEGDDVKDKWVISEYGFVVKADRIENNYLIHSNGGSNYLHYYKFIILTTDQDLIKDGVQAIPDEFLEWFVPKSNDSGKPIDIIEVEDNIVASPQVNHGYPYRFIIIIPKEEPKQLDIKELNKLDDIEIEEMSNDWGTISKQKESKQETLKEVAERILANNIDGLRDALNDDDLFFFYKGVVQCYGEDMAKWQQEQDRWKTVFEETPPSNIELLAKSPSGCTHLTGWREGYQIFSCQNKSESTDGWKWKKI